MTQTLKFRTANKFPGYHWRTVELSNGQHIDIIKDDEFGGDYILELRYEDEDYHRSYRRITDFCKYRAAKAYAEDFAAYLLGDAPQPKIFADKYIDLDC